MALFLFGISGLTTSGPFSSNTCGGCAAFQNNWLMVLFKINASSSRLPADTLTILNFLDLAIMVLFGILFLCLHAVFQRTHKIGSAIAASLPFLGLILFLITHTAGRSGLLLGGLIFSILMLGNNTFSKGCAWTGIAASSLLFFAGDLGTTFFPPSNVIAALIGIGYGLWGFWFFLVGRSLLHYGTRKSQIA
jgi:hypothetical protein